MEFENQFLDTLNSVENKTVYDSLVKAKEIISNHDRIVVSISGGADSDVVLDLISKVDPEHKAKYVYFDTGLEYQATKNHIQYLKDKYGVEITKYTPKKPIPIAVKEYGVPFLNKHASEMIYRLQLHNFQWEDEPFEVLYKKYPRCYQALSWWCNRVSPTGKPGQFDIDHNKYLKEFMIANPIPFKVASKCCDHAKKNIAHDINKKYQSDLNITGVRRAERGVRITAYKNCFTQNTDKYDDFRPIFWYSDEDKAYYDEHFNVCHSDCYSVYGLKRTGCVGCPYGKNFDEELAVVQKYEPKLYKACMSIFGKSYEYTRKYKEFAKMMREKNKNK